MPSLVRSWSLVVGSWLMDGGGTSARAAVCDSSHPNSAVRACPADVSYRTRLALCCEPPGRPRYAGRPTTSGQIEQAPKRRSNHMKRTWPQDWESRKQGVGCHFCADLTGQSFHSGRISEDGSSNAFSSLVTSTICCSAISCLTSTSISFRGTSMTPRPSGLCPGIHLRSREELFTERFRQLRDARTASARVQE